MYRYIRQSRSVNKRHVAVAYAAVWFAVGMVVFIHPCLVFCTAIHHSFASYATENQIPAAFICQLDLETLAAISPATSNKQGIAGSLPSNRSPSFLQITNEYLVQPFLNITLPALLLAFLTAGCCARFISLDVRPPTPPPRPVA